MDTTKEAVRGDGRVVLDMTVSATDVAPIGEMNGHEGDNGRIIKFVLYGQGNHPVNIQGYTVDLVGTDAAGKLKVGGHYQPVDPAVGTFDFTMPGAFYQQEGDYSRAYFRIKDGNGQIVSTINVMFTVVAGVGFLTSGDSQIYNGHVEDLMQQTETTVKKYTDTIQKMVDGNQGEVTAIRSLIDNMLAELKNNQAALLGANNDFTGNNHFGGTTTIDKLDGKAAIDLRNQINQLGDSFASRLPKFADVWNRDYTWGPHISRANNGNDFALSKFMLSDNLFMIIGRGDIKVNQVGTQWWESTLTIPWKIDSATMMIADWSTYKGYFKPYHAAFKDNTFSISCSGEYSGDIFPLNLIAIAFQH